MSLQTLTSDSAGLLVGAEGAENEPVMLRLDGDDRSETIQIRPGDGYGAEADWYGVVVAGDKMVALGGARGGAHSNVRWSVWRSIRAAGQWAPVIEEPQTFETFGGPDAGELVAPAVVGEDTMLVGSWKGTIGLDLAIWQPQDGALGTPPDQTKWTRTDPPPAALANTPKQLKEGVSVASTGDTLVIGGNVVDLADGPQVRPVIWTYRTGQWQQHELAGEGRVLSVGCAADSCLAVGADNGGLVRAWRLDGPGVGQVSELRLPPFKIADRAVIPVPLMRSGSAGSWLALPSADGTALFELDGAEVTPLQAPAGVPVAQTAVADRSYLITRTPDSRTHLWRTG